MMDYACSIRKFAACSHVMKLQMLQSNCLCTVTDAPWFVGNRQIEENFWVSFFVEHIGALTENFGSKLADEWNPLVRQIVLNKCRLVSSTVLADSDW
jgi:hypothetical protein